MEVVAVGPLYPIIGLVVALLGTLLVYKAIKNTRRARLLARVPWSKIGQLQPGLVKVQGQALAVRGTLRSPLTGRECVYYHFQVQEKRRRGGAPLLVSDKGLDEVKVASSATFGDSVVETGPAISGPMLTGSPSRR